MSQLFTTPFPEESSCPIIDVVERIAVFVILSLCSISLLVTVPAALLGWAIKCYSQPDETKTPPEHLRTPSPVPLPPPLLVQNTHNNSVNLQGALISVEESILMEHPDNSETLLGSPNPPSPALLPLLDEYHNLSHLEDNPVSLQETTPVNLHESPSFDSPPPDIINAAQKKAEELRNLYNELKTLNGPDAQRLFQGIEQFHFAYDQYRNLNLDPFEVDAMMKSFNIIDFIDANTSGMQCALEHWSNFYRVQADAQGVIPQPKDGNCWLHTSILGLQHINYLQEKDEATHIRLRAKVVQWMRDNYEEDATLRRFIGNAIETHKDFEERYIQQQADSLHGAIAAELISFQEAQASLEGYRNLRERLQNFTVANYFDHMAEIGSHGSHAELYAISRLFDVNIAIWRDVPSGENAPRRLTKEYDEPIEYSSAEHTINAVLTQEGNHFNYRLPSGEVGSSGSYAS